MIIWAVPKWYVQSLVIINISSVSYKIFYNRFSVEYKKYSCVGRVFVLSPKTFWPFHVVAVFQRKVTENVPKRMTAMHAERLSLQMSTFGDVFVAVAVVLTHGFGGSGGSDGDS